MNIIKVLLCMNLNVFINTIIETTSLTKEELENLN